MLKNVYRVLGVGMVVLPLSAVAVAELATSPGGKSTKIFWLEAVGVWVFAAFWAIKTGELALTDAEQAAAEGKLEAAPPAPGGKPIGRLVQTAPLTTDMSVELASGDNPVATGRTEAQLV